jgi:hypothetical protein
MIQTSTSETGTPAPPASESAPDLFCSALSDGVRSTHVRIQGLPSHENTRLSLLELRTGSHQTFKGGSPQGSKLEIVIIRDRRMIHS